MSDPQTQTEHLISNQQTAIHVGTAAGGGSSSRAYKVAGFTLLACLLIAGQALAAYFVLSQKDDIKSLQEQNDNLQDDLSQGRAAAGPIKMHVPMNAMPKLIDFTEETSTELPKKGHEYATQCQLEAAGQKVVALPLFRPRCDDDGNYLAQQCWQGKHCWCVDTNGREIDGTLVNGAAKCDRVPATEDGFDVQPEPNLVVSSKQ